MYFHSVDDTTTWKQTTYLATSSDGLRFESMPEPMGLPYLRVFELDEDWWGVAKARGGPGGVLLRASSPNGPFEAGPLFINGMRHAAILVQDDLVEVFFSRIGDEPERLLVTSIDPDKMWREPYEPVLRELIRPEVPYEGADMAIGKSAVGETTSRVNALRDPYVYSSVGGQTYLFYAIAGESGIAVARISR